MRELEKVEHPFAPVYDENATILILGTLPSVQSRKAGFYYGNPRNAFWRIMASVCGCPAPESVEAKKEMLLRHHIALWDVCQSCDIRGSSDSSIRNEVPADIPSLLQKTSIQRIYANSRKAAEQYDRLVKPQTHLDIITLPSTSPAYCAISEQEKLRVWKEKIILTP